MSPRIFTTADGLLPVDLAHCGLDNLTSAKILFNSDPSFYDSAGYLAHIGVKLLFKGWLLETTGRFEGIHNLVALHSQLVSFGVAPKLDDQSLIVLALLDQYESLRYPNRKNTTEVGQDNWSAIEAPVGLLRRSLPLSIARELGNVVFGHNAGRILMKKRSKVGLVKLRSSLTNLNTPISAISPILIGPIGHKVEGKWQETVKVFTMHVRI